MKKQFGDSGDTQIQTQKRLRDLLADISIVATRDGGFTVFFFRKRFGMEEQMAQHTSHIDEALLLIREEMLKIQNNLNPKE